MMKYIRIIVFIILVGLTVYGIFSPRNEIPSNLVTQSELEQRLSPFEENIKFGGNNAVGGKLYFLGGSGVSSSQTTIPLTSFQIAGGSQPLTMTDFGNLGCGTIEPGNQTKQEFVSFTGVTQNGDGSATLTGVSRGLSPIPDYTASTTLQYSHPGGSRFVISNSPPCFYEGYANITQDESITGWWMFPNALPAASSTATTSLQLTNKAYVDAVTNAGAATSTQTNGGIVELATAIEAASTTNDGTGNKPLALWAGIASSSPDQTNTGPLVVVSNTSRKLAQAWLDLTADFTWTGHHIFSSLFSTSASTTNATTTNFSLTGMLNWGSLYYTAPSTHNATNTVLANDGSGGLSFISPTFQLLSATTTEQAMAVASTTFSGASEIEVSIHVPNHISSAGTFSMQFNNDSGSNYGYWLEQRPADDILSSAGTGNIRLSGTSTTTPLYINMNITNVAGDVKRITWDGSHSTTTVMYARISGHASWNNTSNQITSLKVFTDGPTLPVGTTIRVYGK